MRLCTTEKRPSSRLLQLLTVHSAAFAEQPDFDVELRQHHFRRTAYTDCHLRVIATANVQRAELRCTAYLAPLRW
jgi:hypothetical protein